MLFLSIACSNLLVVTSVHSHALEHKLTLAHDSSASSAVVGVLPSNAAVLLMDTNNVGHLERLTLVIVEHRAEVPNRTKAVTSKFLKQLC
jgi:hypothetical protein